MEKVREKRLIIAGSKRNKKGQNSPQVSQARMIELSRDYQVA
jgi:hypothetical protein